MAEDTVTQNSYTTLTDVTRRTRTRKAGASCLPEKRMCCPRCLLFNLLIPKNGLDIAI